MRIPIILRFLMFKAVKVFDKSRIGGKRVSKKQLVYDKIIGGVGRTSAAMTDFPD